MRIARDYGEMLRGNNLKKDLEPDALTQLIESYPSHSFVINAKEAGRLFQSVIVPADYELLVALRFARKISTPVPPSEAPFHADVRALLEREVAEKKDAKTKTDRLTRSSSPQKNGQRGKSSQRKASKKKSRGKPASTGQQERDRGATPISKEAA